MWVVVLRIENVATVYFILFNGTLFLGNTVEILSVLYKKKRNINFYFMFCRWPKSRRMVITVRGSKKQR